MNPLLEIALVNTALAAILAAIVFATTRIWRNPHLAHFLWLIVLLKMVTPPLISVPVSFGFLWKADEIASMAPMDLGAPERDTFSEQSDIVAFESAVATNVPIGPPLVNEPRLFVRFCIGGIPFCG